MPTTTQLPAVSKKTLSTTPIQIFYQSLLRHYRHPNFSNKA